MVPIQMMTTTFSTLKLCVHTLYAENTRSVSECKHSECLIVYIVTNLWPPRNLTPIIKLHIIAQNFTAILGIEFGSLCSKGMFELKENLN